MRNIRDMTSKLTQIWRTCLLTGLAGLMLGTTPAAAAATEIRHDAPLTVTREPDGAYRVAAGFKVNAPRPVVWAVLTDYPNMPSFVRALRTSVVTARDTASATVVQHAVGRLGPFRRSLHVTLHIVETAPSRIEFRDISHQSFTSYAGTWEITEDADGVHVSYDLVARPHTAPPLFGRSILGTNARDLLEEVRVEILRRSVRATAR